MNAGWIKFAVQIVLSIAGFLIGGGLVKVVGGDRLGWVLVMLGVSVAIGFVAGLLESEVRA